MKMRNLADLDLHIARARIFLSLATLSSIYVDPNVPDMDPIDPIDGRSDAHRPLRMAALCTHLAYSGVMHATGSYRPFGRRLRITSTVLDIFLAVVIAVFTEGRTSPSFVFFVFAIIATACRERFQATITLTACSAILSGPDHHIVARRHPERLSDAPDLSRDRRIPDQLPRRAARGVRNASSRPRKPLTAASHCPLIARRVHTVARRGEASSRDLQAVALRGAMRSHGFSSTTW